MSAPVVRVAGPDDVDAIAALEALAASHPWTRDDFARMVPLRTSRAFLAGEPAVGYLLASSVSGTGEILTVGVHPEARRAGIGAALLAAIATAWRADGVTEAFLEVRRDNFGAIALYERAGWVPCGVRKRYYADGQDGLVFRLEVVP